VLRLLVTPRWIGWTLCALAAVAVCGGMAYWQLLRAESPAGSLLNAGYAFQWPLFGLFFAALWWRMLRAEARALDEVRAEEAPEKTPAERLEPVRAAAGDSPFGPRPSRPIIATQVGDDPVPSPERARWNAMYAELAAREGPRDTPNEESDPS
jgi:DNA-binding transcriptional regulator of glucitol operon